MPEIPKNNPSVANKLLRKEQHDPLYYHPNAVRSLSKKITRTPFQLFVSPPAKKPEASQNQPTPFTSKRK